MKDEIRWDSKNSNKDHNLSGPESKGNSTRYQHDLHQGGQAQRKRTTPVILCGCAPCVSGLCCVHVCCCAVCTFVVVLCARLSLCSVHVCCCAVCTFACRCAVCTRVVVLCARPLVVVLCARVLSCDTRARLPCRARVRLLLCCVHISSVVAVLCAHLLFRCYVHTRCRRVVISFGYR